ncbi:hypothetical protein [Rathayibacter soli]|uniref:hypothetical protein n=1 Tax=Rathayibacter soli TaxID=3144168 RepID=UPI0027E5AC30|nr:hypothetical protein [Glaciibacter superstes]
MESHSPGPAASTATRFTTLWGGCGIAASALLSLLIGLPFITLNGVTALSWYPVPNVVLSVVSFIAALILAGAVFCLGFGVRGETGLVGGSRTGRIAVGVFVIATVVGGLVRLLVVVWSGPAPYEPLVVRGYLLAGLGAVALASLIVAVIVVLRRRALNRALRWGLAIVIAWTLLRQAVSYFPFVPAQPNATFTGILIFAGNGYNVGLLLQIVLGASIALHGQAAALRRRAAIINEHW